jgi:hypothetical protein
MQLNNIESVRLVLIDIVAYIKSLDVVDENTRNELLKIHED